MDTDLLIKQSGIGHEKLDDPDASISIDDLTCLWHKAAQLSKNPAIGLMLGKQPNLSLTFPMGLNLLLSKNIGEAMHRLIGLQEAAGFAFHARLQPYESGLKIIFDRHKGNLPHPVQGFDASLAFSIFIIRFATNIDVLPKYVSFVHPEPSDRTPYDEIFKCQLKFDQPEYAIFINNKDLLIPSLLSGGLENLGNVPAISTSKKTEFPEIVRSFIKQELAQGEPSLKAVAAHLNLGSRTLQRRLKQDDWTYTTLLDDTRKLMADFLLLESSVSLKQITYELGFSDHSNFYHAFKRWHNCAPGEYRDSKKS